MGTAATDSTTLGFTFSGDYSRLYEIKVTQLPCSNEYARYPGCLQYHTGLTGRVETFNYLNCPAQTHLPNQDYSICVRPEAGYDCVQWQICQDNTATTCGAKTVGSYVFPDVKACAAFSVGTLKAENKKIGNNEQCSNDYISIAGASKPCCQGSNPQPQASAICGYYFDINPITAKEDLGTTDAQVCDCVAPYNVDVVFDGFNDMGTDKTDDNNELT